MLLQQRDANQMEEAMEIHRETAAGKGVIILYLIILRIYLSDLPK